MTYVTLQEQIRIKLQQLEFIARQAQIQEQLQGQSASTPISTSPDKSQGLGCSPDVNRLGIANIAINTASLEPAGVRENSKENKAARSGAHRYSSSNEVDHFAMISSLDHSRRASFNQQLGLNGTTNTTERHISTLPSNNTSYRQNSRGEAGHQQRPSAFFSQVQRLDMFGSNFKPGTPSTNTEDIIGHTRGHSATESWSRKAANDPVAEYVMQPISSIEQPTSNSQQSNSAGFTSNSVIRDTQFSICSV